MARGERVLAGTTKGLFILHREETGWCVQGPLCAGWPINHAIGAGEALWAAGGGDWHGAGVWRSGDGGETWALSALSEGQMAEWARADPEAAAFMGFDISAPPAPHTGQVEALWSLGRSGDRLFAGGKPGMLYVSEDGGESWAPVTGLTGHPSRDSWNPGAAGMVLHTIVSDPGDPRRMWVAISAAGVLATEDGGVTWERRNRLSNAEGCGQHDHPAAPKDGETGHCVHNMVRAPSGGPGSGTGDVLYQQNHHGVFRSRDGGRSWDDITAGLPSTFGFPVAVHPRDPGTLWTLPLNGDTEGRYPPGASAAVWRSRDGGDTWEACRTGLPQEACFFTVLRQAMATDASGGVYFGTNTGSVFASADAGDSWQEIARHLPTVLCVETVAPA